MVTVNQSPGNYYILLRGVTSRTTTQWLKVLFKKILDRGDFQNFTVTSLSKDVISDKI